MDIKITSFPAENGESNLIECFGKKKTNILIDLGFYKTYANFIKKKLKKLANDGGKIDLLVLSHYDADHIEGAIGFFQDLLSECFIEIGEIWVNDLLALSSIEIAADDVNISQGVVYEFSKFIMKAYRQDSSKILNSEISSKDSITITKLLKALGYNDKVNKSFRHKIVCIDNKIEDYLTINDEVEVKLLSPNKNNLKKILFEFLKWLEINKEEFAFIGDNELFEMFVANFDENMQKDIRTIIKQKNITSSINPEQVIDDILSNGNVFIDKSISNKSSIAFYMKFHETKLMFTGDIDVESIINKSDKSVYKLDLLKVSHHGSKNNTDTLFLNTLECCNYLICTNGSRSSKHPDIDTLVHIAQKGMCNVYMNYKINKMNISDSLMDVLIDRYKLKIFQADGERNQILEIIFDKGELTWKAVSY